MRCDAQELVRLQSAVAQCIHLLDPRLITVRAHPESSRILYMYTVIRILYAVGTNHILQKYRTMDAEM